MDYNKWVSDNSGISGVSSYRLMVKAFLRGRATQEQADTAIITWERINKRKLARRAKQVWVHTSLVDGKVYETLSVWSPNTGDTKLYNVQFVESARRGTALYHVTQKSAGADYSEKTGSIIEVQK